MTADGEGAYVSTMRVIGVLDIAGGCAVHARGGERAAYRPVTTPLIPVAGDAVALAHAYRDDLGIEELYIADLDAIQRKPVQWQLLEQLTPLEMALMVDGGVTSATLARQLVDLGTTRVIVGLETLTSFDALAAIVDELGPHRVVFSLDLRQGIPLGPRGTELAAPIDFVERAVAARVASVIVLDVARVGSGRGVDYQLLAQIRRTFADIELLAGGGVRRLADLEDAARCGCDGTLVGTALLEGQIGRDEVEAARPLGRRRHPHPSVSR